MRTGQNQLRWALALAVTLILSVVSPFAATAQEPSVEVGDEVYITDYGNTVVIGATDDAVLLDLRPFNDGCQPYPGDYHATLVPEGVPVLVDGHHTFTTADTMAQLRPGPLVTYAYAGEPRRWDPELRAQYRAFERGLVHDDLRGYPVSHQGDAVVMVDPQGKRAPSYCLIGYIDATHSRAYTAGHCGHDGDHVYRADDKQMPQNYLGTFSTDYVPGVGDLEDFGYITPAPGRERLLGGNIVTGDDNVPADELPPDTLLCTHTKAGDVPLCRPLVSVDGPVVFSDNTANGDAGKNTMGDSGSPVWITTPQGRRFVGMHVAVTRDETRALTVTLPEHIFPAPPPSTHNIHGVNGVRGDPVGQDRGSIEGDASSSWSVGVTAGTVLAILAAVGFYVAGWLTSIF